jgi:hypothetical protein
MTAQAAQLSDRETSFGGMIFTLLRTGVTSVIVWEIWARFMTPLWIGEPLEPAGHLRFACRRRGCKSTSGIKTVLRNFKTLCFFPLSDYQPPPFAKAPIL